MPLWGLTDEETSKPKYLSAADKAKAVFVDTEEASAPANKARGIKTAGWHLVKEKTDSNGIVRYMSECLVAVAVKPADAGDDDDIGTDDLKITLHPVSHTVDAPDSTTFTVDSNDAAATYQWQVRAVTGSYSNVSGANYTGGTTKTLTIVNTLGLDNYKFRCVVKSGSGDTSFNSNVGVLTVVEGLLILTQPQNQTKNSGQTATFSVTTNKSGVNFKWESSTDGSVYTEVSGAEYSGTDTDTLTIEELDGLDGLMLRCVLTLDGESVTSDAATLTVTLA